MSGLIVKDLNISTRMLLASLELRKLRVLEALYQKPRADIFHYITGSDTGVLLVFLKLCERER